MRGVSELVCASDTGSSEVFEEGGLITRMGDTYINIIVDDRNREQQKHWSKHWCDLNYS